MDPLNQPVISTLPFGATIITMRTEQKGLIGAELRVNVGAAGATLHNPAWTGLPHFAEHMAAHGSSRRYGWRQISDYVKTKYFSPYNASTSFNFTSYFKAEQGLVFPKDKFWRPFSAVCDGVFFPKYVESEIEIERQRIFEEIGMRNTERNAEHDVLSAKAFNEPLFALSACGTAEQVASYKADDLRAFHAWAYGQKNVCAAFVGDVDHKEIKERVSALLRDVPAGEEGPRMGIPRIQSGEARLPYVERTDGYVMVEMLFPSKSVASGEAYYAHFLTARAVCDLLGERIQKKYKMYNAGVARSGGFKPSLAIGFGSSNLKLLGEAMFGSLDYVYGAKIQQRIVAKAKQARQRIVFAQQTAQPSVQQEATRLLTEHFMGMNVLSKEDDIACFARVTPDQIKMEFEEIKASPLFLQVCGDKNAFGAVPPLEKIDAVRGYVPTRPVEKAFFYYSACEAK